MASDYRLHINGVKGESQEEPEFIELDSFSFGASNPADVGGKGLSAGKCSLSDFSFTCALDSASWQILKDLYKGTHVDESVFKGYKAGGDGKTYRYLEVTMTNCYITAQSTGGGSSGLPSQSVSLAYEQIKYEYFTQDTSTGQVTSAGTAQYNIGTGVAA
jgi:type VI secretion system secreted protein Hcp